MIFIIDQIIKSMINIAYIYIITNIDDNPNKVYIGKTIHINYRRHFHHSKFGKNIIYSVIDQISFSNHKEWKFLESYWIEQLRQWGFELVNKNKGGGGPQFHPEEIRIKMRKPKSEETKHRMRAPRVNIANFSNPKPKRKKPITQLDLLGNMVQDFGCCHDAAVALGLNEKAINNVLIGRAKTSGGFLWKYKN